MPRLSIRHDTHYTYDRPVGFAPQRLLVRPRDSHAMRLIDASLELSPPGQTRWVYDAMGNSICWFTPQGEATELRIVSNLVIDRYPAPLAPIRPDDPNSLFPMVYGQADRLTLAPFVIPETTDEARTISSWLRTLMGPPDEPVLAVLTRINNAIHADFEYAARYEEGTQSPAKTLERKSGTCRDFAWLMVEAVRRLGCAAVFVTGYLYAPEAARRGAGATHAWCEIFLPGLGWIEFDPTNGLVESSDLIRIGGTLTPAEAAPIAGNLIGDPGNSNLTVSVDVRQAEPLAA